MKLKELNPRITCVDGTSLSVQANQFVYCSPRIDEVNEWKHYDSVEVGYIRDAEGGSLAPDISWSHYSDGTFPSSVYGYVPVGMVKAFIASHGGEINLKTKP